VRSLLALLGAALLRVLSSTWRVRLRGPEPPYERGPIVFCFWHGAQAALFAHPRPRPVAVLASLSRDGTLQAKILARLGFEVLRGSSSRGGAAGLMGIVGALRRGCDAAFAVDGPRGPLHAVKPGALLAARETGAAIVPIAVRASRAWVFERAWDKYALPKPFARVELVRGASMDPTKATPERIAEALGGEIGVEVEGPTVT
jgi:lysophospholipid acyltransferase (LPLAT)-like uncharacterized protein